MLTRHREPDTLIYMTNQPTQGESIIMATFTIADSTVTVDHDGRDYDVDFGAYRQRYAYSIVTPDWRYDGNDIHSGCYSDPDVDDAARTLFSFLAACAESRQYVTRNGGHGENSDMFPVHVGEWAEQNSDELSMLSTDPANIDV